MDAELRPVLRKTNDARAVRLECQLRRHRPTRRAARRHRSSDPRTRPTASDSRIARARCAARCWCWRGNTRPHRAAVDGRIRWPAVGGSSATSAGSAASAERREIRAAAIRPRRPSAAGGEVGQPAPRRIGHQLDLPARRSARYRRAVRFAQRAIVDQIEAWPGVENRRDEPRANRARGCRRRGSDRGSLPA